MNQHVIDFLIVRLNRLYTTLTVISRKYKFGPVRSASRETIEKLNSEIDLTEERIRLECSEVSQ